MKTYKIIKKLRKEAGLSQQELAEMVGYSDRSSIAKVEAGLVDLTRSKIEAFARAFRVSPSSLVNDEEAAMAEDSPPPLSRRAVTTASAYDALNDNSKDIVDALIAALRNGEHR